MTTAPIVTRGDTVTVGHSDYYGANRPQGTYVLVDEDAFIEIRGALYAVCGRCETDTPGRIPHYGHTAAGVCFKCNGAGHAQHVGTVEDAAKVVARRVKARARAAAKRQAKQDALAAERDAWAAANPEVAAALAEINGEAPEGDWQPVDYDAYKAYEAKWGDFLITLSQQASHRALTEKQTAAVLPAYEEQIAQTAAAAAKTAAQRYLDVPVGAKVTVTGAVAVSVSVEHASYAGYGTTHSCLVVVEGTGEYTGVTVKMFGTGATLWATERGQTVEVTGTVKDFTEYDGVPQTVLTRAKVKILGGAEQ